jgi:hypothetical protein
VSDAEGVAAALRHIKQFLVHGAQLGADGNDIARVELFTLKRALELVTLYQQQGITLCHVKLAKLNERREPRQVGMLCGGFVHSWAPPTRADAVAPAASPVFARATRASRARRESIQRRMSSTRHAVIPAESLTGAMNSWAATLRHNVAEDHGMMGGEPGRARFGPLPARLFASACSGVTSDSPIS